MLIAVDYLTIMVKLEVLENKRTNSIMKALEKIFEAIGKPEKLISDNAKELDNKYFRAFCIDKKIDNIRVSIESHKSNGRVERVIRTIRERMVKSIEKNLKIKLEDIEK